MAKSKETGIDKQTALWMYQTMTTTRMFEAECRRQADQGKLRGMHSSIGQEAVPTGICAHLKDGDQILGTHRSHHHCIAKGVNLNEMMAELLGKSTGTNKGKGGTMHIADINKGMLGANGVVGSNIPVAVGAALTSKLKGSQNVSVVFFGDGAVGQGVLYESMNLASIWKLPVIFVCENNRYAEATPFEYSMAGQSVAKRAPGFAMPGINVDGQSVVEMYNASKVAIQKARSGEGPTLIEEAALYKSKECIDRMKSYLIDMGVSDEEEISGMDEKANIAVAESVKFADESPFPNLEELHTEVYVKYE